MASKSSSKKPPAKTIAGIDVATLQWVAVFAVLAVIAVTAIVLSDGSTPGPHGG